MKKLLTLTLLLLITSILFDACLCYDEQLIESIRTTYSKLVEAEKRGADVSDAALKLNRALQLLKEAEINPERRDVLLSEARALVREVDASISLLIQEGESRLFWRNVMIVFTASLAVVVAVLTYRFGPRIFWEAWLRLRSKWVVRVVGRSQMKGERNDR